MITITSKIFKKIDDDDNIYIKNYLKESVGIITSKIFKENTTKLSSLNT